MRLVRREILAGREVGVEHHVPVAVGLAEVDADVDPLGRHQPARAPSSRLLDALGIRSALLGIGGREPPADDVPDHAEASLSSSARRSRTGSTRQMVCTRSSISSTGISSAYSVEQRLVVEDVALLELESPLAGHLEHDRAGVVAEVTSGLTEEGQARRRHAPRLCGSCPRPRTRPRANAP